MSHGARRWLLGCGIGCLLLVLLAAATCGGGALFVRNLVREFQRTEDSARLLARRHGRPADYCPPPDGHVPPERVRAFLRARELMEPTRLEMEALLARLAGEPPGQDGRRPGVLSRVNAGLEFLPRLAHWLDRRNEALLEADMGLGEYSYLYTLSFWVWLERSPADGPPFRLAGDDGEDDRVGPDDEFSVRDDRLERSLRRANRLFRPMLECQLERLGEEEGLDPAWRRALAEEVASLEADLFRLPWRDGLPAPLAESLEPFRAELAASYSTLCNPLEIALTTH